jgi:hypothetical protein
MTIVVCVDEVYWNKSQILFKSLEKNWHGRVCVLCVDFKPALTYIGVNIYPDNFEFSICSKENLECFRTDWPSNRPFYFCCESGEFFNYFTFDPNELVIHLDADMIMQREMSETEVATIEHIEQGEIAMSPSAYPIMTLREELFRLNPRRGYERINQDYPGILGEILLYCTGMVIARAYTYRRLRDYYLANIDKMIANFNHHAASQWILCYIARSSFNVIKLNSVWHNASWFIDTQAKEVDEQLTTFGQVVIFNHTKFEKEYRY